MTVKERETVNQEDTKKYPEHAKMEKVDTESHAIGQFIEWLHGQGIYFAKYDDDSEDFVPEYRSIEKWLADYFEIDLNKVEAEKRQMLDEIREYQKRAGLPY